MFKLESVLHENRVFPPSDVFWCTADVGWVTGHSYVCYGPLACGATEIIFEGVPVFPDAGRFWKMIQDHKVTVFYTAPTVIRALIKAGGDLPKKIVKILQDWAAKEIGPITKPKDMRSGDNLPKTRSGKIMRRLLRSIAKGEEITQDVSTLVNPAILDQLKQPL